MATGKHEITDRIELAEASTWPVFVGALAVGGVGLIGALIAALFDWSRFLHAYLTSYMFFTTIVLGALFFVLIQHVVKAGWSVVVRRLAEAMAVVMPLMAVLALPMLVSVVSQQGHLYPWAVSSDTIDEIEEQMHHGGHHGEDHGAEQASLVPGPFMPVAAGHNHDHAGHDHGSDAHGDDAHATDAPGDASHGEGDHAEGAEQAEALPDLSELTLGKRAWLNPMFFLVRAALYLIGLVAIGLWLWRTSTSQDETGDLEATRRMEWWSPLLVIAFGAMLTCMSFDMVMSLEPSWYSTMYGVYIFAGAVVGAMASLILLCLLLQRAGYLTSVITDEHYHDMGKLLFAFTFFWGYIAFSQYMLYWYANMPETNFWFRNRGVTTLEADAAYFKPWVWVSIILLAGHFVIPFLGLLSRHVKRNRLVLAFWCVWMLVFHWIDVFWQIMPQRTAIKPGGETPLGETVSLPIGFYELLSFMAIGGLFVAALVWVLRQRKLLAVQDPRLAESVGFHNI